MIKHLTPWLVLVAACFICGSRILSAQTASTSLLTFLQNRLADSAQAAPPPYERLLAVIDGIATADPSGLRAALPSLDLALRSTTNNLSVEAAFALSEIARRRDGGVILGSHARNVAAMLASSDERLSGGAVLTLGYFHRSVPETTGPLLIGSLDSRDKPSLVKAEVTRILLQSQPATSALQAVERYLGQNAEPHR